MIYNYSLPNAWKKSAAFTILWQTRSANQGWIDLVFVNMACGLFFVQSLWAWTTALVYSCGKVRLPGNKVGSVDRRRLTTTVPFLFVWCWIHLHNEWWVDYLNFRLTAFIRYLRRTSWVKNHPSVTYTLITYSVFIPPPWNVMTLSTVWSSHVFTTNGVFRR